MHEMQECFQEKWTDDRASQIVEFALSLPLLVLFVVGIFDFSGAVTLKQRLSNAVREGARVAAADPANDLVGFPAAGVPASVSDAYQVVDNYLLSEKMNDCGLSSSPTQTNSGLTWTYTANGNGCPARGITLTINRGNLIPQAGGQPTLVTTVVSISYPYTWQFGGVKGLFGGSFILPSNISSAAIALNEN
jgi:Flp pilus assembly protein TadG